MLLASRSMTHKIHLAKIRPTACLLALAVAATACADSRAGNTPSWRAGDCVVSDGVAVGVIGPDALIYPSPQADPVALVGPSIGSVEVDATLDAGVIGAEAVVLPLDGARSVCP